MLIIFGILYFSLYIDIRDDQWPLVYDDKYNVSFCGFEKFHVFDAKKWRNIIQVIFFITTQKRIIAPLSRSNVFILVICYKWINLFVVLNIIFINEFIIYFLCLLLQYLLEAKFITPECLVKPLEAKENELLVVHTKKYLKSLKVRHMYNHSFR